MTCLFSSWWDDDHTTQFFPLPRAWLSTPYFVNRSRKAATAIAVVEGGCGAMSQIVVSVELAVPLSPTSRVFDIDVEDAVSIWTVSPLSLQLLLLLLMPLPDDLALPVATSLAIFIRSRTRLCRTAPLKMTDSLGNMPHNHSSFSRVVISSPTSTSCRYSQVWSGRSGLLSYLRL